MELESAEREARFVAIRADWHRRFPPRVVREPPALTFKQFKRWSSLTLRGSLSLPPGTYQAFDVAMKLGKIMKADGTFDWIRTPGDVSCVEVRAVHRDRVLGLLDRSKRTWRDDVVAWEAVRMAHRCPGLPRGTVRLFIEPESKCPACGAAL